VSQNHGGECTVWSELGVGTTFTLRLPTYTPATPFDHDVEGMDIDVIPVPIGEAQS
jgi:hypothetical protein